MLGEVKRFHAHARRLIEHADGDGGDDVDGLTLGTFLALGGYSPYFVRHFMIPVVSCVWSSGTRASLAYPALYLFRFLDNHGMLSVTGSPRWRTVICASARASPPTAPGPRSCEPARRAATRPSARPSGPPRPPGGPSARGPLPSSGSQREPPARPCDGLLRRGGGGGEPR